MEETKGTRRRDISLAHLNILASLHRLENWSILSCGNGSHGLRKKDLSEGVLAFGCSSQPMQLDLSLFLPWLPSAPLEHVYNAVSSTSSSAPSQRYIVTSCFVFPLCSISRFFTRLFQKKTLTFRILFPYHPSNLRYFNHRNGSSVASKIAFLRLRISNVVRNVIRRERDGRGGGRANQEAENQNLVELRFTDPARRANCLKTRATRRNSGREREKD